MKTIEALNNALEFVEEIGRELTLCSRLEAKRGQLEQELTRALAAKPDLPDESTDDAPPLGKAWFYCTTNVNSVQGWQQWRVAAATLEEAKKLFASGGGEFVAEELEVQDFDAPEWHE